MNIVVTVKQVVDPNLPPSYIKLDATGTKIVPPPGIAQVMNGYDANALECALKLREAHGGRVTVICLGDDSARAVLKRALAMGADAAVLLSDARWVGLDSCGVAQTLAAGVKKIGAFDLVLCGRQASDTDGGQVLYWLAETLGIPIVSPVSKIEAAAAEDFIVHRLMEDGFQRVRARLPALLGISSEINEPRTPSLKGTMAAARVLIPAWKAADVATGSMHTKVVLRRLEVQVRTTKAKLVDGESAAAKGAALADKLHEEGII